MKNDQFYKLLHSRSDEKTGRRMSTTILAERIGSSRAHVTEVLNNKPGHGGNSTRRRLFPHLNPDEVRTLGWTEEYDRWRRSRSWKSSGMSQPVRSTRNIVPTETHAE